MINLATMRARLRRQIGNPDTVDVPNSELDEHINTAYIDISSRYRFHRMRKLCEFQTVSGIDKYGLPSDCEAVIRVRDGTTGAKIWKRGERYATRLRASTNAIPHHPLSYVRQRDWLLLDPTPDKVYTIQIYYKASVPSLVQDNDFPIIPGSWHSGIIKLARHVFYDDRGDIPKAQYALSIYNSWLSTKTIEVDEEKTDIDEGVEIPTLKGWGQHRLSFDEE